MSKPFHGLKGNFQVSAHKRSGVLKVTIMAVKRCYNEVKLFKVTTDASVSLTVLLITFITKNVHFFSKLFFCEALVS